jgi:hypothetical protein
VKTLAHIAVLAGCVIGFATVSARAAPTTNRTLLQLVRRAPVTLSGAHFKLGEKVRVTVHASQTITRVVRTTKTGTFLVTFRGLEASRCSTLRAAALGSQGDSAQLKVLPLPACISQ